MTDRDSALLALRPTLSADPEAAHTEVEAFFHATLRPVLKLQNDLILALVAVDVSKRVPGFAAFTPEDQHARLAALMRSDSRLKRLLLGVVFGMLTAPELEIAMRHESEVRRRIASLLAERVASQTGAVGDRVTQQDALRRTG